MFLFRRKNRSKISEQNSKFDEPVSLEPVERIAVSRPNVLPAEVDADAPAVDPLQRKRRRVTNANKTRLMGFDTSDGRTVELFDGDKATDVSIKFQFPVGIVMVTKGPGFGESFAIKSGMSQIGRGEDQAIRLDFGDLAISRENHAAVVYDPKAHTFLIGHGGKSNIVRLNGKPVVSTSKLKNGDEIEIGETTLRFAALCSPKFNWEISATEEGSDDDDVEIA